MFADTTRYAFKGPYSVWEVPLGAKVAIINRSDDAWDASDVVTVVEPHPDMVNLRYGGDRFFYSQEDHGVYAFKDEDILMEVYEVAE